MLTCCHLVTFYVVKLLVGLGNPGKKYMNTRHNIGAMVLKSLFPDVSFSLHKKLQSLKAECRSPEDLVLLLPQTFMNLSGDAVVQAKKWYKLSQEQIIVFHDEIDLPVNEVKYKYDGGHGGHNGIRDIMAKTGDGGFHRFRLGVGRPPNNSQSVSDYVLSPLTELPLELMQNLKVTLDQSDLLSL